MASGTLKRFNGASWDDMLVTPKAHNHAISEVVGLQSELDGKLTPANINSEVPTFGNLTDGLSNLPYKADIIVYGDHDKYYPVYIWAGNQDLQRVIKIWRRYSEHPAPDEWNTATHHGSLMLTWRGNFGGWGGASYVEEILANTSQYTTLLADCKKFSLSMGYIFFLRGGGPGGAIYHFASDQPLDDQYAYAVDAGPVAYYNGAADKVFDHTTNDSYDRYAEEPLTAVNTDRLDGLMLAKKSDLDGIGGGGTWGSITGTLSDQADLKTALDGKMQAETDGSYYGLKDPLNNNANWIRTTVNGLIPYQSGGASALGTSSWPFTNIYGENIYDGGISLETKYGVHVASSPPSSPHTGKWWLNTGDTSNNRNVNNMYFWNGSAWIGINEFQ